MSSRSMVVSVGLLVSGVVPTWAGLEMQPQVLELLATPGVPTEGTLTLTNTGEQILSLHAEMEPWRSTNPEDQRIPISSWLEIQPNRLELPPHQSQSLHYVVTLPPGVTGERAAMAFFSENVAPQTEGVGFRTRIGIPLYAVAQGTEQVELVLEGLSLATYDTGGEGVANAQRGIRTDVVIHNQGNVHVRPKGMVTLYTADTSTEAIPPATITMQHGHPVYSKSHRVFSGFWKEGRLTPGRYRAVCHIDYGEWYGVARAAEQTALFTVNGAGEILMDLPVKLPGAAGDVVN